MALSWNEIKHRALEFSKNWEDGCNEKADAQSFLIDFFYVFGISRRRYATFEHKVKKLDDSSGYIDCLWKGNILVEMKSRGENLDKAYRQAIGYTYGLDEVELPKYILVSDFDRFILYNLDSNTNISFHLSEFYKNVAHFDEMIGYQKKIYKEEDPVNIEAAELMGRLHDRLKEIGYGGHALEVYLVRLLFCLFADDTTIFDKQQFQDYITIRTSEDGSDLASKLHELFQVLNTRHDERFKNLDEQLLDFPYINGRLFEEMLPIASFDSSMRKALIKCSSINWSKISPAIFGSMFQSVMDPIGRRNLGAHYTSEKNILKLIKSLFLDELWSDFNRIKNNVPKLREFHDRLSKMKFLDPACGCGNFLIITYRELRLLELEILRTQYKFKEATEQTLTVSSYVWLDVDQFYGIEYEEFPARIAEVAMWLIDHQMNMAVSQEFGQYFVRLPLSKNAKIINGDALEIDWNNLLDNGSFDYILGNPPFIGSKMMSELQRAQVVREFDNVSGRGSLGGTLDYVSAWYLKAAKYIQNRKTKVALVSTNSIVQGEQVGILWNELINSYNIRIHFAHKTFRWKNEARNNAAVYCIIIGFASYDSANKLIFEYEDINGEPHEVKAKNINPYLIDAENILIHNRNKPICDVPKMSFGNMPLDGGNLLLSDDEIIEFLEKEPGAEKYIRPLISAREYLNNQKRWCLWLVDANPSDLKKMPEVLKRIEAVKNFRLKSIAPSTRKFASTPTLFRDRNNPETYIVIPSTTSENRKYIPMGFFGKESISNNSCHIIPDGNLFHFGVLMSEMHMTWVKYVCGKLESRYRYSKEIVYNNFPWPMAPSDKQIRTIENKAKNVLSIRAKFSDSSLATLYDPRTMPVDLVKAHQELDKAVDLAYRRQTFTSEAKRMEYLFDLYFNYTK